MPFPYPWPHPPPPPPPHPNMINPPFLPPPPRLSPTPTTIPSRPPLRLTLRSARPLGHAAAVFPGARVPDPPRTYSDLFCPIIHACLNTQHYLPLRNAYSSDPHFASDFRIAVESIQEELVFRPRPLPALLNSLGYISADDQESWLYAHPSSFADPVSSATNPLRGSLLALRHIQALAASLVCHGPPDPHLPPRPGGSTFPPRLDPTNDRGPYPDYSVDRNSLPRSHHN